MEQAAEWAPLAYARAIKEWPWIGVISYWYFKPADEHNQGDSSYYFRMVEPDFTPTPIYEALKAYITSDAPKTIGRGRHDIHPFQTFSDITNTQYEFSVQGTAVYACYDEAPAWFAFWSFGRGGKTVDLPPDSPPGCVLLYDGLGPGEHTIGVMVPIYSDLDSIVVVDDTARHRLPWLLTGIVAGVIVVVVLGCALYIRLGRPRL
jgi:hypothetical protein